MTFFTAELKNILDLTSYAAYPITYSGRVALVCLDEDLRAKIEFLSLEIKNQYNAIRVTILNRKKGEVDKNTLLMADIFRKSTGRIGTQMQYSEKFRPHIWEDTSRNNVGWYLVSPGPNDRKKMGTCIEEYLTVFDSHR